MRAVDLNIKQRLRRAIDRPLSTDWPIELHRNALAEIERLEAYIDDVERKAANAGLGYGFLYRSGHRP